MREFTDRAEVWRFLRSERNWGRWGEDDELGALNLITSDKRRRSAALVRSGRIVSLSRPFPLEPAPDNPTPAKRLVKRVERGPTAGSMVDRLEIDYHGTGSTHIDALCHVWDEDGMWNGRNADDEIDEQAGSRFAHIDTLGDGIVTRGVLLDVPRHRGVEYVTADEPVTGDELAAVAAATGVEIEPGDAVAVYSGRERFSTVNTPWGAGSLEVATSRRPGLHVSCLPFLREVDAALLVWDMMDVRPNGFDLAFAVHAAIWSLGVALVDNALLEPLSLACAEEQRWEFQLIVAPLRVSGGSGSPVNPLALF